MNRQEGAKTRPDTAGLVIAALLAIISGVVAWDASQIADLQSYARVGPKAFPYAIAGALLLFAVLTALHALKRAPLRDRDQPVPVLWIIGGLTAQLLVIPYTGFSIATGLLFSATAKAFGRGNFLITIPVGIALSLFLWILFSKGLALNLPAGPLERLF
jgi:putative tricarboxylic transport membrane protein